MELNVDRETCRPTTKNEYLLVAVGNHLVKVDHQSFGKQDSSIYGEMKFNISCMEQNSITGEIFIADNFEKKIYSYALESDRLTELVNDKIIKVSALSFGW